MADFLAPQGISIGRPPVFFGQNGLPVPLPVHARFQSSRAKRKVLVIHRRGRKTSMALEEVFKILLANPGITGKTLAPQRKQAKENIWMDPDMLFSPNICPPEIIKRRNDTELYVELINGSMYFLDGCDDPHSKRGANTKVLHLTEAGDHDPAVWYQVYEPILIANGGVAILEGNPRGRNWYFELFNKAASRPGWETFHLSAEDSPIFTSDELADLRASIPENVYRSEYLCEWIDSSGTVFRNFDACATAVPLVAPQEIHFPEYFISPADRIPFGAGFKAGLDLAKHQDYTVFTVVDTSSNRMVYMDRFNALSWEEIKARLKADFLFFSDLKNGNSLEVTIETNGIGDPIFDDLFAWSSGKDVRFDHDVRLNPFTTSAKSKERIVNNLSMLFDTGHIKILNDRVLLEELGRFTFEKRANGFYYSAPPGEHDDCFVAGTLVLTDRGNVPIEQIKVGDLVMTRDGLKPVVLTRSRVKDVITRNDLGLTGTPTHPVITTTGEVDLQHVCDSDTLYVWNEKLLCIEKRNITDTRNRTADSLRSTSGDMISGKNPLSRFIGRFGLTILGIFQMVLLFTTRTVIRLITALGIWSVSLRASIPVITWIGSAESNPARRPKKIFGEKNLKQIVPLVEKSLHIEDWLGQSIAAQNATNVATIKERVFNLQVADRHEYFANNILVHNCVMSVALAASTLEWPPRPARIREAKPQTRFGVPLATWNNAHQASPQKSFLLE